MLLVQIRRRKSSTEDNNRKESHTIPLISAYMAELSPLLDLGLARLTGRRIRRIRIFSLCTEQFILLLLVSSFHSFSNNNNRVNVNMVHTLLTPVFPSVGPLPDLAFASPPPPSVLDGEP